MSDDSASWYQRKLAQLRGPQPAAPPYQPHPYTQQPQPRGLPTQWSPRGQSTIAVETIEEAVAGMPQYFDPNGNPLAQAALWRGGDATKHEHDSCPQCGSGNYFSRTNNLRGMSPQLQRRPPAPHCFECGFNGLYDLGVPPG